jgi:hypothetical protein
MVTEHGDVVAQQSLVEVMRFTSLDDHYVAGRIILMKSGEPQMS